MGTDTFLVRVWDRGEWPNKRVSLVSSQMGGVFSISSRHIPLDIAKERMEELANVYNNFGRWFPIETAPTDKTMFVAIGVTEGNVFTGNSPYTTDPYCIWIQDGEYVRWPHEWAPTHYASIPFTKFVGEF